MSYKVQYSAEARQDLKDIFNYIGMSLGTAVDLDFYP